MCAYALVRLRTLGFVLALTAATAMGSQTGTISGTVQDPSGAGISGALVKVSSLEGAKSFSATVPTDNGGKFELPAIPAGHYEVELSKPGFRSDQRKDIVLNPDGKVQLDVQLGISEAAEMIEVVGNSQGQPGLLPSPAAGTPAGGNLKPVKLLSQTKPIYPEEARRKGVEGTVLVSAVVGTEGDVLSARVINGPDPVLAKAALAAVNEYHFEPMMLNGEAIEAVTTISVRFRLAK